MNRNKLLLVIITSCVIIGVALTISIPIVKAPEEVAVVASSVNIDLQHREFMAQANELEKDLSNLESELDRQIQELQALHRELKKEQDLEDTLTSIIITEGYPKPTEEYARKLSRLIIDINREYAKKYGFDEDIAKMMGIIRVESVFDTNCTSHVGAKGLMQLMDSTGRPISQKLGFTEYKPYDPEQNIRVAWYYYNTEKERLGEDKATVAYNQGYRNLTQAVSRSMSSRKSYWSKVKTFDDKYSTHLEESLSEN